MSFIRLNNTDCNKLKTDYKKTPSTISLNQRPSSEPVSQVALFKMGVWQVFPPRPHTCGSYQEKDEQNVSKAVSVLIFMEGYTFDLNPIDHKALRNQKNVCISKSVAAWEALLFASFGVFSGKIVPNAHCNLALTIKTAAITS